jgi:putative FmdB family regulatory protein
MSRPPSVFVQAVSSARLRPWAEAGAVVGFRGADGGRLEMPKYEYACKSCGEHLEVVQSFKDSALTECPACGGRLRKVFGSIGIVLKGSGFYRTDNRTSSAPRAERSEKPEATTSSGSGEAKGGTDKPEAKVDKPKAEKAGSEAKTKTA